MAKYITIRNVPPDISRELKKELRRRGVSLNQAVLDLLRRALGLGPDGRFDNGLGRLAGSWTQEDLTRFEEATALFEQIDEELWQ